MMPNEADKSFMRRAIELAMRGRGLVEPNPMVGCVLVRDGAIIGEGFHQHFGGPHAEPNALADCLTRGQSPRGATAYVTLEPCCHTDKKTPPCAPSLIEARIARVVVGCLDPNPQVNGQGLAMLRRAGIEIAPPATENGCKQLIAPFIARVIHARPYVTLKWAQSADGKVAGPAGQRAQISNEHSMRVVHELRARCDAILVGLRTVLSDDPMLTPRGVATLRPLLRVVLDPDLRLPLESRLAKSARQCPLLVCCATDAPADRRKALESAGVMIESVQRHDRHLLLDDVLHVLACRGCTHVLVEPGPTLAKSFIASGLTDRIWLFRSPTLIGHENAPEAPEVPFACVAQTDLSGDKLCEHLNPASPVFFSPQPSADFQLAATTRPPTL